MADVRAPELTQPPMDTSAKAWVVAHERINSLRPDQKAQLANTMSIDCERLARAGIAVVEPTASEDRVRHLLAVRRYRPDFADAAFGPSSC